ncbi:MAG: hypothetical protein JW827_11545 [Spirochaetes bacterium]|nr:hypothetical protein [Spirochaetota bacterium]
MFKKTLTLLILSSLISFSLRGADDLPLLKTKARRLAVFKNGLGFFIRDGKVVFKNGLAVTEDVPLATLGSVWVGSPDKGVIFEEVIGYKEERKTNYEAVDIAELLKANIGKKAVITYGDKTIEGKIKSVPDDRTFPGDLQYDFSGRYVPQPQFKASSLVIIQTGDGIVALNKHSIAKVDFPSDVNEKYPAMEKAKKIKFKVSAKDKETRVSLSYLQKGISWIPSYLINIEDPERARITMKATVINDIEDMEDVDIYFVVGYPNFLYANILSPMAMEEQINQFISSLESGRRDVRSYGHMANIMRQSASFESEEEPGGIDFGYDAIKGMPGESEEDLFLYKKQGVRLNRGERADYHIFSEKVEYKHIFKWDVPDTTMVDYSGYSRSQQSREREQVWHVIKLNNSTSYPWTTAPAFTVSGWKPLAQDMINYTPRGTKAELKLTVASDVKVDRKEYEIKRQRDLKIKYRTYDLVTIKGELSINNRKEKNVNMEITKTVTGQVIETSHNGKSKKVAEALQGINSRSEIRWDTVIKAGKKEKIIYSYKVYIAH